MFLGNAGSGKTTTLNLLRRNYRTKLDNTLQLSGTDEPEESIILSNLSNVSNFPAQ